VIELLPAQAPGRKFQLADIVARVNAGDVKVDVSATYPLDDIVRVHQLGAAGDFRGKVLLVPTI
jgi:NADPH:quinone reductase-like Zn-dependent oxidoreductase